MQRKTGALNAISGSERAAIEAKMQTGYALVLRHMAHQTGWIEMYSILEKGNDPDPQLVEQCKSSKTGIGETMLHWYAIEGTSDILQKHIDLGFEVNVQNIFGNTPIMECSQINRWDNARVLLNNDADLSITNDEGQDYFRFLHEYGVTIPEWIREAPNKANGPGGE